MGNDRTPPARRTTVAEAAEILGISAEAVRGRIRRGTLPVEREGGKVYVLLEAEPEDRTDADQPRTTGDQPGDRTDALIAELQDRVRSLEEANSENRRIIAALTSRIPELPPMEEAPRNILQHLEDEEHLMDEAEMKARTDEQRQQWHEHRYGAPPRGSPETGAEEAERVAPRPDAPGTQEGVRRPWWRRWFGG